MYRGPRPHRGAYPPAASRGFAPRAPPPASSFSSAPYGSELARGSNGYPHDYRRHPEHPRRRCSSPGRGDGPPPRDYGHRYTPSPPHGGHSTDHRLAITVGNKLKGSSQNSGAEIPYSRDYSPHHSSYEVHDERTSSRTSHTRFRNRGWSRSPDRSHSRIPPRSRSRSPTGSRSRAVNQGYSRPRSRGRSRSRDRSQSISKNNKSKEDFKELKRAYVCKELENMLTMPTKSILKKRLDSSETNSPMMGQMDFSSSGQCAYFPLSKQPTDEDPAFLCSSGPSDTAFKSTCNPPSVLSNTVELFKRLINEASTISHKSNNRPIVYDQKSSREMKVQSFSTLASHLSQFSHEDCDQGSTSESSSTRSSATERKSNLATQMERFLGALNKGDSKLLSSLVKHARKDTDPVDNRRIPQEQAGRKVSCGDKLYDRGEDNAPLMGSKQIMNPGFGRVQNTQDDLLPHERAVVDGSGFSKIVGMKYGTEAKPSNRFLYGGAIPSSSQNRLLEEPKTSLKEYDQFKQSQDHNDVPYFEESYAEDRKRYKRQSPSKRYRVEGSRSPVHQKSVDANEDQKASHYKKIQDLLQTIGLNLDTTEVSKLADRTNERLYGKKVKPRSSHSFDQKDELPVSRCDRRGSSHSTDSEDVSVSPAKTSNSEVYTSYLHSVKNRRDEVTVRERDLLSRKRTLRNIPEAKQTDLYKTSPPEATHDPFKLPVEESSLAQSVNLQYTQVSSDFTSSAPNLKNKQDYSYGKGGEQNPYGSISQNPQHYTTGYSMPPPLPMLSSSFPSGYGYYRPSATPLMPPSPAQFFPSLFTFNSPRTFGPSPTPPYPHPLGQFGFAMQPGSSAYVTQQAKTKTKNRCLKTIETVQTQESVINKISAAKEVCTVINIKTENAAVPMLEDDIKAKAKREQLCEQK